MSGGLFSCISASRDFGKRSFVSCATSILYLVLIDKDKGIEKAQ